jgi:hypothetical protein
VCVGVSSVFLWLIHSLPYTPSSHSPSSGKGFRVFEALRVGRGPSGFESFRVVTVAKVLKVSRVLIRGELERRRV